LLLGLKGCYAKVSKEMKKVLFVTPTLGGVSGGGAERVVVHIANSLDRKRYQPVIVTVTKGRCYEKMVQNHVGLISLDKRRALHAVFGLIALIRRERPSIVFTTVSHINLLVGFISAFASRKVRFVARESAILSIRNQKYKHKRLMNFIFSLSFKNFDKVVCQSQGMKTDLLDHYITDCEKVVVINNPVDAYQIRRLAETKQQLFGEGDINLVSVGRLSYEKGFDLMIQVLAKLDNNYVLTILGEGEERLRLESLAKALKVEKRICMPGFTLNPYAYMHAADLFILPSRFEGFPNVVLEANACGTPVVAFASPGGVSEIIVEGENGWLVPPEDIEGMAMKITGIMESDRPGRDQVRQAVISRYSLPLIASRYEALFELVTQGEPGYFIKKVGETVITPYNSKY